MTDSSGRAASVHVLRVTLRDVRPAVWRRLAVPSAITLGQLHLVLQAAFDWSDDHLHDFEVRGIRYAPASPDPVGPAVFGEPSRDEELASLGRVAPRPGDVVDYTYDFGDNWQHRLEVERVELARPDVQYPECTDGAGLAPEEDTGRTRPGQFGDHARHRLNGRLRRLGAVGRDLPVEDVPADPPFTGLFPDLDDAVAGECPCGCGETSGASAQPVLPMLDPVPDEELARLAAGSPLVQRSVALATWIGTGRALTPSHLLRPADAVRAVDELDLTLVLPPLPGGGAPASAADAETADGTFLQADAPSTDAASPADGQGARQGSPRHPAGEHGQGRGQQVIPLFGEAEGPTVTDQVLDRPPGSRRVRSAKDLPSLQPLWTGCLAAGLIEIRGGKAYPGPGLAVWQVPADPTAQVEGWCALLGGYMRARDDAARAGRDRLSRIRRQVLQLGIPLLYTMAREPVPVGALSLAFADLDELEDAFGLSLLRRLPIMLAELGRAMEDWLVAGVVEQAALPREDADGLIDRVAELQAGVEEQLALLMAPAAGSDWVTDLRAGLQGVARALLDGPAVRLTPLGSYGLARVLTAHGWHVPQAGACLDAEPEELLDRLVAYLLPDAEQEAARWLDARGEGWARAVEKVMWSAAVKGEDGPARRGVLPTVLGAAGQRVAPVLDAATGDPWLAPVLAVARYQLGLGPEPSLGQLLWLIVDGLSPTLDDPDAFAEELQDSPLEELLAQHSAFAEAVGLDHPHAREVLQAAAPQLDDPDLRRALRKALAGRSGNPSLRSGARRPRGSSGQGKSIGRRRGGR